MSILLSTLVITSTLALAPVRAQPAPEPSDQDADAAALVRQDDDGRWYVFGEEELTGEVLGPEGELIPWRRPPMRESLIRIRSHFLPELLALVRDLK